MKLYRYMSIVEFVKMSSGMDMKPFHMRFNPGATISKGFCFLGRKTFGRTHGPHAQEYHFNPLECLTFMSNVVDDEVLVEFEADDNIDMGYGYGFYNNPHDSEKSMTINEYYLLDYDKSKLKPQRFILGPSLNPNENKWIDFSNEEEYDIRSLMNQLIQEKGYVSFDRKAMRKLGFLPSVPNTSENEMWRVIDDYDHREIILMYGNPITNENRFGMMFNVDSKVFAFGGKTPEAWKPLKELYDSHHQQLKNPNNMFFIAALIASYPQILKRYELVVEERNGESSINLTDGRIILSMEDLALMMNKDGSLGVNYLEPKSILDDSDELEL